MSPTTFAAAALLAVAAPALAAPIETARSGPWSVEVVDERGAPLPTFEHRGRTYVLGALGQRYLVRVRNASPRRVEVVVSVDGRDVIDGRPAAFEKRGYLVDPWGEATIDGYRLSQESVAAFRFSSVPRSYASRMGDARDVGVIGVAVFPERAYRPPPRPYLPYGSSPQAQRDAAPPPAESGAAPSAKSAARGLALEDSQRRERPGLGTEFAEEHDSHVRQVPFERAGPRPDAVLTVRYDDRDGLLALGIDVDRRGWSAADDAWVREHASPFRRDGFSEPPPGWRP